MGWVNFTSDDFNVSLAFYYIFRTSMKGFQGVPIRARWFSKNFPDFFGHERVFMSDWIRMNKHISRSQKGLFTLAQISVFKWTHLLKRKYSRFWFNSLCKIFKIKTRVLKFLCDWIEQILYNIINQIYKNYLEQTSK